MCVCIYIYIYINTFREGKHHLWFLQCLKEVGGHISPAEGSESPLFTGSGGLYAAGRSHAESETVNWRHLSR